MNPSRRIIVKSLSIARLICCVGVIVCQVGEPPRALASNSNTTSSVTGPTPLSFDERQQQGIRDNPSGLVYTLATSDGKTRYRCGETITVEFTFKNLSKSKFRADIWGEHRNGRDNSEVFYTDKPGNTIDPYHSQGVGGWAIFISGPFQRRQPLDDKPKQISMVLNQWCAFDKPGTYRIYATTARLAHERALDKKPLDPFESYSADILTSNIITLTIVPADPAWQEKILDSAAKKLNPTNEHRDFAGINLLRFLRTPDAALKLEQLCVDGSMVPDVESGTDGLIEALWESPHRAMLVNEMLRQIEDPDVSVSTEFMEILTSLHYYLLHPNPKAGASPGLRYSESLSPPEKKKDAEFKNQILNSLMSSIPKKHARAKAVCVETAMYLDDDNKASFQHKRKWEDALIPLFSGLPLRDQEGLLSDGASDFAHEPRLLPVLRRLVAWQSPKNASGASDLRDRLRWMAAQRLIELAPDHNRPAILADIRRPYPTMPFSVLTRLPDKSLPALDRVLAANLEHIAHVNGDVTLETSLICRYSTRSILPRVKAVYLTHRHSWVSSSPWAWEDMLDPQSDFLAYFLRVDPNFGAEELETSIDRRSDVGSELTLFRSVTARYMCPLLQEILIRHLDDGGLIGADAAISLGQHGSQDVEPILWDRLRAWNKKWNGSHDDTKIEADGQYPAGLGSALACGSAWITESAELEKIHSLCLSKTVASHIGLYLIGASRLDEYKQKDNGDLLNVSVSPDNLFMSESPGGTWSVGQYHLASFDNLKRKLLQFPKGTVFITEPDSIYENTKWMRHALSQIETFLKQHGMKHRNFVETH